MANNMRWRYGETNPVMMPVDSATLVEIGDLLYLATDDVRPASSLDSLGTLAATLEAFHDNFVGVAMQCSPVGTAEPIRVATTGVFEFECASATFDVGDLIGGNDAGVGELDNQIVDEVATPNLAVGFWLAGEFFNTKHKETFVSLNYRELKRRYELDGADRTVAHLSEALQHKDLAPEDFSIRDLAEALVPEGRQWVRMLDPRSGGNVSVMEATDGVDVTAFLNVAGQVVHSKILEAYTQESFVVSKLVQTIPTRLDGEKIPGVGRVADKIDEVAPGMPYPHLGFGEDYIETPNTSKRGFIVPVTKEAIFFDRTHLILSRAAEVGEILGLNKEKRLLDVVIGETNNYKANGTSYDTYYANGPWANSMGGNALVDWTNVDIAEQLFADMLDPNTGEPVLVRGTTVLVMPAYRHAAHRIFNAVEINYSATGSQTQTTAANPLGNYRVEESRLAYRRIIAAGVAAAEAKKWWFIGDFRKAFAYMENWPITVTQAPLNSEADFNNDVVLRFKASERGAAAVLNPRLMVKCTG